MSVIFEIAVKQIITVYIGGTILYLFYRIRGKNIPYSKIINEDNKYGVKKYRYKAFYLGIFTITLAVILIAIIFQ